ncbi:MAG: hypothetical protein ACTSU2_11640 [Promethearchaeota archaeon]
MSTNENLNQDLGDQLNSGSYFISKGMKPIKTTILVKCPNCGYKRKFKNEFTLDKMDLIIVSIKIIDWMTCDRCGSLLNTEVHFTL